MSELKKNGLDGADRKPVSDHTNARGLMQWLENVGILESAQNIVEKKHGASFPGVLSDARYRNVVNARAELAFLIRKKFGMSYPAIGQLLNRDQSSIQSLLLRFEAPATMGPDATTAERDLYRAAIQDVLDIPLVDEVARAKLVAAMEQGNKLR